MSELVPVIASSNRFLDFQPYCSFLYSSEPQKWGFILPWEFPQFASREVEEAFLRTWFAEEEIRMQGGAFGEGHGFKFLKQVWYCISLFNLEHRIPAITNMWMERNQNIWTDPAMQQHICREDVQYSTFFSEEEQRKYGKLLHWVIKNIQLRVQQANNQDEGGEQLAKSKTDGEEQLATNKTDGEEASATEDVEKLMSSSLLTTQCTPICEPVGQTVSKSAEISKVKPAAIEATPQSTHSMSAASSSVRERERNQPDRSSDQDHPSLGMNTGVHVPPRKRGNSGSHRHNTNNNAGPGRVNQNVPRNPYFTPQYQPPMQFPQPNVGDLYPPTMAQNDMRVLSGPAQMTGLPPQFQPPMSFNNGPTFFDPSQHLPVSGTNPMISNSGYIGPMPQYQNPYFTASNLADMRNERCNPRSLSDSIPPPNNHEDFGNAKRGGKRRESISSRGKSRGYHNARGGRGSYSRNSFGDDRPDQGTFSAGGYIEQGIANPFPPPHDGCKNEYPTLRRQPPGSHGGWRDRQMQAENLPPRSVFHGLSKDSNQGPQGTGMSSMQTAKTEFPAQSQFQSIVNVSVTHPQESIRPFGTFFHEESSENALRNPERVVTKHRIGKDCTHVRKLIAFDVPEDLPVDQIVGHFSRFGPVTNVERSVDRYRREGKYAKHPRNVWVTFESHITAQVALAHGATLWSGPPIKVEVPREFWDSTHMYYPGHELHRETAKAASGSASHQQRPVTIRTHHTGIGQIGDQSASDQSTPVAAKCSVESQKMPNEYQSGKTTPTASTANTPKKSKNKNKNKNKNRQLQKANEGQVPETESPRSEAHTGLDKSDEDKSIEVPCVPQESNAAAGGCVPSMQSLQPEKPAQVAPEAYISLDSDNGERQKPGDETVAKTSAVSLDVQTNSEQFFNVGSASQSPPSPNSIKNLQDDTLQRGPSQVLEQACEVALSAEASILSDCIGEPNAKKATAGHVFEMTDGTIYEDAQAEIALQSKSSASPEKSEADDSFHTASGSPDSDRGRGRSADHVHDTANKIDETAVTEIDTLENEVGDTHVRSPSGTSSPSLSSSVTITKPNKPLKQTDDLAVVTGNNVKDSKQSICTAPMESPTPALITAPATPSVPLEGQGSSSAAPLQVKKLEKPEKPKGPAQTESVMGAMFAKPPKQKTKKQKTKKNKKTNENKPGIAAEGVSETVSHAPLGSASSSVKDDHSVSTPQPYDSATVHEAQKQPENRSTDVASSEKVSDYTAAPAKPEVTSSDQDRSSSKTRGFLSTLFGGNKGLDAALADVKAAQQDPEASTLKEKQAESASAQGFIPGLTGKTVSSSDSVVISIRLDKPFRVVSGQREDNTSCDGGHGGGFELSHNSGDDAHHVLGTSTADGVGSGAEDTVTEAAKSKKKRKKKKPGNKRGHVDELEEDDHALVAPSPSRETTPGTPEIEWVAPNHSGAGTQSITVDVVSEESSHTLGKTPTPEQSPSPGDKTVHEPSAMQKKVEAARAKNSSGSIIATPPVRRKKGRRVASTSVVSNSGPVSGRATPTEDAQTMKAIPLLRSTVDSDDEVRKPHSAPQTPLIGSAKSLQDMKRETRFMYWYQGPQPSQDGTDGEIDALSDIDHNDIFEQVQQRAHDSFGVDDSLCADESFDTASVPSDGLE